MYKITDDQLVTRAKLRDTMSYWADEIEGRTAQMIAERIKGMDNRHVITETIDLIASLTQWADRYAKLTKQVACLEAVNEQLRDELRAMSELSRTDKDCPSG